MSDEYYEEEPAAPAKRRRVVKSQTLSADQFSETVVDEEPRPAKAAKSGSGIRGGWAAAQQQVDASSTFAQGFRLSNVPQIIKFLEDAPYAGYSRHWVQRANGKRPYTCLQSVGKECPLCSVDPRPQSTTAFNIAVVEEDGSVSHKTWDVGSRVFNTIRNFATNSKHGGLTFGYYAVTKVGQGQQSQTTILPVRESLLVEDYDVDPPSADDLKFVLYTADIIPVPSVDELREIASELASGDDY